MADNKKKVEIEVTGVMSGDYEAACMDVSEKEYERLMGEKPEEFEQEKNIIIKNINVRKYVMYHIIYSIKFHTYPISFSIVTYSWH